MSFCERTLLSLEFDKIFKKYGLKYSMGFEWTLTCYREDFNE